MKKVFYSFYFDEDNWRTNQVRNIGVIDETFKVEGNGWESVKSDSDETIKRWIDRQIASSDCTVVLIGSNTSYRKWVKYEIEKTWNAGKGLCGLYIHGFEDSFGRESFMGQNPFLEFTMQNGGYLSDYVKAYNPVGDTGTQRYAWVSQNVKAIVDEAIQIRNRN